MTDTEKCKKEKVFADAIDLVCAEIKSVLLEKGRLYGHDVLKVTGKAGLITRIFDKVFRLKNLEIDNPEIGDPEDTWQDLLGYAILGVLMNKGYFDTEKYIVVEDMENIDIQSHDYPCECDEP